MSTRIPTFLKPHIFYPDSCGRCLKSPWRAVSKQHGFGDWIHWFRVDRGPIFVKKTIRIPVEVAYSSLKNVTAFD